MTAEAEEAPSAIVAAMSAKSPFVPTWWLRGPHRQTIAAARRRRRFPWGWQQEEVSFETLADGSVVELRRVDAGPGTPLVILFHGMSGSARSGTVLGLAHKAWRQGWSSLRVNLYDVAERLEPPRIFHAGVSSVVHELVAAELAADRTQTLALAGVSKGANLVLKALGEWGTEVPSAVLGAGVISPLIDLSMSWHLLEQPRNRLYQSYYVGRLKALIMARQVRFQNRLDLKQVARIRTILEFDTMVTAPLSGYRSVFQYYEDAGSRRRLSQIRVPTLIIHSRDDPFLPWAPLTGGDVRANPYLLVWLTRQGGHAGFLEAQPSGHDRSWAENRTVEFLARLRAGRRADSSPE